MTALLNDRDVSFLLYEFLDTEALLARPRYAEHSREIFDATLNTARQIAEEKFAPFAQKGDDEEPSFDGTNVHVIPETKAAWQAYAAAGFLNAHWEAEEGGLQIPEIILRAAMAYINAADGPSAGYGFLTIGAANLVREFCTPELQARYLAAMGDGRCAGTMALTEPGQGSALGDIKTSAEPQADGSYRVFGQKMFISGGDQNITDNIVHMVLARIKGAPAGVKGISLFLVPKFLVNEDGSSGGKLGARNDVALAGLLHKMGYRNTTSTVLSFGEKGGAVGYLVGTAGQGLAHMFQMMNEARIGVGLGAASTAYRAYLLSLDYARERPQGRLPSCRDPLSPQVKLVEHADIRRLLLLQKAIAEGSLALCFYASTLFEDQRTHPNPEARAEAALLLDLLTPMVKSFPSGHGCRSNEAAIQILGGSGYIREYPLEKLYRDQRLNPIHEGAEGIHGLDLLGRKVSMKGGAALRLFALKVGAGVTAAKEHAELAPLAKALETAVQRLLEITGPLVALQASDPDRALANATVYLDAFGRILVAWIWLSQATIARAALHRMGSAGAAAEIAFYQGKLQTAKYFFEWELPVTGHQFELLSKQAAAPLEMQDAWF